MSVLGSTTEAVWTAREGRDWRNKAACAKKGVDPEWFFEAADYSLNRQRASDEHRIGLERRAMAKGLAVCAGCPVREACLAASIGERFGAWGGTTPTERRILRRRAEWDERRGQMLLVAGSVVGSARASVEASEDAG